MSLQPICKDRGQRESLDATEWTGVTSRPISMQFCRFWVFSNANSVKDVVEVIVIRCVYILISNIRYRRYHSFFLTLVSTPVQHQQQLGRGSMASW